VAQPNRGRVSVPAQAALSGSHNQAPGFAGGIDSKERHRGTRDKDRADKLRTSDSQPNLSEDRTGHEGDLDHRDIVLAGERGKQNMAGESVRINTYRCRKRKAI